MAERFLEGLEPNSDKYRREKAAEQTREIRKVETKGAKLKKRGLGARLIDTFIKEKPEEVRKYVIKEVVVPAIMDTIYDSIMSALGMTFWQKADRRRSGGGSSLGSKFTNYSAISTPSIRKERTPAYGGSKGSLKSFDNLVFDSKGEAEDVRDSMIEALDRYGYLTVLEFYDIAQVTVDNFTDNNWGWKRDSIGQMKILGDSANGYYINLPRCEPLD